MASKSSSKVLWLVLAVLLISTLAFGTYKFGMASLWQRQSTSTPVEVEAEVETETATTDGVNDFSACKEDISNYCPEFLSADWATEAAEAGYVTGSWKLGLVDCLEKNREKTTQACDDSQDRRQALNEDLNTACATDRNTYCKGVEPMPGSEPQVDCLMENYDSLSLTCQEAVDAHEEAKPVE